MPVISLAFVGCTSTQGSARYSAPVVNISGETVTINQSPIVRDTTNGADKAYDIGASLAADAHVGSPQVGDSGSNAESARPENKPEENNESEVDNGGETEAEKEPLRSEPGSEGRKSNGEETTSE